jgi:hypothetical protein
LSLATLLSAFVPVSDVNHDLEADSQEILATVHGYPDSFEAVMKSEY